MKKRSFIKKKSVKNIKLTRSTLTKAVAVAILAAINVPTAMAGSGSCSNGANVISGAETSTCTLDSGDSLQITSSGSISTGGDGVYGENVTLGFITNEGSIDVGGYGIYAFGDISGGVSNSGIIDSSSHGIYVYNSTGSVINSGRIDTGDTGIYIYGPGKTSATSVTNSGTIDASDKGMYIYGNITGDVTNSGTLRASNYGIYIYDSIIGGSMINSGSIDSGYSGMYIFGGTKIAGDLINSGKIKSGGYGVYLYESTVGGAVVNSGTVDSSDTSLYLYAPGETVAASVTNSGKLISDNDKGIYVNGEVTGDVVNSGIIDSYDTGIYLYNPDNKVAANVTNTGTIMSEDDKGIYVNGEVTGNVVNSGLIDTYDTGIYLYNDGNKVASNVTNSGTILSEDDKGIYVNGEVTGDVVNSGLIDTYDTGIYLYNNGSKVASNVTNRGTIISSDDKGIYINGDITGNVVNSGTIQSYNDAIYIYDSTIDGTVLNSGLIQSQEAGIYVNDNSDIGSIVNSGTIESDGYGIYVYGSDPTVRNGISNSGLIDSGDVGVYIDSTNISGNFTNTGSILGGIDITGPNVINQGLIHTRDNNSYVSGNYSQSADGEFRTTATDSATFSTLDVTGTATFASGSALGVLVSSSDLDTDFADGSTMAGVVTAGTLNASNLTVRDNSLARQFVAVKNGNDVDILVLESQLAKQGLTTIAAANAAGGFGPGAGAASAVDQLMAADPEGEAAFAFGSLNSAGEVSAAVESVLPALAGGVANMALGTANALTNIVTDRQTGAASGDKTFLTDRNLWLKAFDGNTDQDKRDDVAGYDIDSHGIAIGFDGEASSDWRVGVALARMQSDVESDISVGDHEVHAKTIYGKVYATYKVDEDTDLHLQAGYGESEHDSDRVIVNGAVASTDYDSKHYGLKAELARKKSITDEFSIEPYVSVDYKKVEVDSYSETGAGVFNLNVDDDSVDSLVLSVGSRGRFSPTENLAFTGNAGIGYDLSTERSSVTASFAGGGSQFSVKGMEPDEIVYDLGLGAVYAITDGTEFSVNYDLNAREDYLDQNINVKVNWNF